MSCTSPQLQRSHLGSRLGGRLLSVSAAPASDPSTPEASLGRGKLADNRHRIGYTALGRESITPKHNVIMPSPSTSG